MYACLAVTCHLHFWQNDRDFLRATVVTRGWNGYRNKSQHRKSTLEKKILPPFQQGFEPATFQSRVRCSNRWAIPAPTSSVRLTSRALHRLGKCRLSWVWLGFGLLSALSECSACLGRGSHRHASSGFVSVQTDPTAQSWHDLVRTSVFLFTLIVLFIEEFLLHSSGDAVLVRSFSYTPRVMLF